MFAGHQLITHFRCLQGHNMLWKWYVPFICLIQYMRTEKAIYHVGSNIDPAAAGSARPVSIQFPVYAECVYVSLGI